MATKKRVAVKKTSVTKKTSSNTSKKILVSLLLLLIATIFSYQYKDYLLYYLGFKVKDRGLVTSQFEKDRIKAIVTKYSNYVIGIDISQFQGEVDWENIEAIDELFEFKFVIVRATAGCKKIDSQYKRNWKKLSGTPFIQGVYHYYRPDENSTLQANHFIEHVYLKKGHLPPILDIEKLPKNQSIPKLKEGLQNWLNIVEKHYGVKPIIYTSQKYFEDFLQVDFPRYKFWIANYNPWVKSIPEASIMWQFSEKAQLHGINEWVDLNVFKGDIVELKRICNK